MAKGKSHGIVVHGNKQSFFMRFWQRNPESPWQASLEHLNDQEEDTMARLEVVYSMLQAQDDEYEQDAQR